MTIDEHEKLPPEEKEHFATCSKRGEIFVAKTAGEQSSGQCVRRWRAIPRREVFHGIDQCLRPHRGKIP